MLPTIMSSDLGQPTEPGEYEFRDMKVRVGRQHLEAWSEMPDLSFQTILCTKLGDETVRLALGAPSNS